MWEKEEERKIKEKGRKKLVRNFRLRHTLKFAMGKRIQQIILGGGEE